MTARPRTRPGAGWDRYDDLTSNPIPGDMVAALEEIGIKVIREVGDEVLGHCPAHKERTGKEDTHPSWSVNIDSGLFNCFSCGYTGVFVDLVEYQTDLDRGQAVAWTKKRGGMVKAKRRFDQTINTLTVDTSEEMTEARLALFVDPPEEMLAGRRLSLEACQHYGVLWDTTRDMWIIPIRDPDTWALMGWQEKNERYFRNYPYSMRKSTTLFGLEQFPANGVAILVESPLDVVRLKTAGIAGGLSCFGAKPSREQVDLIVNAATNMICAFDNDPSGWTALSNMRKFSRLIRMRVLSYEGNDEKDIGGMTDEQIHAAISNSYSITLARP